MTTIYRYEPELKYPLIDCIYAEINDEYLLIQVGKNEDRTTFINAVIGRNVRYSISRGWNNIDLNLLQLIKNIYICY